MKTDYIEDESLRLPEKSLLKLEQNPKLIKMLADPKLRELLEKIDNSKHRITELQTAMIDNKEGSFMQFVDEVLGTLDVTDAETGQIK